MVNVNTYSYEEAIEVLKNLPNNTSELDVIINYTSDTVRIHTNIDDGVSVSLTPNIEAAAKIYIQDIEKAIRKEHEVELKIPKSVVHQQEILLSFDKAITFIDSLDSERINELYAVIKGNSVHISYIVNNENLDFLKPFTANKIKVKYINSIKRAKLDEINKQKEFKSFLREDPLPKVSTFINNLISKLDIIELSSPEELAEKMKEFGEKYVSDRVEVNEMKKILESLSNITDSTYLDNLKEKIRLYNKKIAELRDEKYKLSELIKNIPNKEKYDIINAENGSYEIVEIPSVHLIKKTVTHYLNYNDNFVYEKMDDDVYQFIANPTMDFMIKNHLSDRILITTEKVPFDKFIITKSGYYLFAVEVIDKSDD